MGEGLKRVAKQYGGMVVESRDERITYDADGNIIKQEKRVNARWSKVKTHGRNMRTSLALDAKGSDDLRVLPINKAD